MAISRQLQNELVSNFTNGVELRNAVSNAVSNPAASNLDIGGHRISNAEYVLALGYLAQDGAGAASCPGGVNMGVGVIVSQSQTPCNFGQVLTITTSTLSDTVATTALNALLDALGITHN